MDFSTLPHSDGLWLSFRHAGNVSSACVRTEHQHLCYAELGANIRTKQVRRSDKDQLEGSNCGIHFSNTSSFSFGTNTMTSQAQPSAFGAMASTQAPAFNFSNTTTATPSFGFGSAVTSTAAPAFGFGQTNPTSQPQSLFGNSGFGGFGASAAPAFGQNTGFTGKIAEVNQKSF